MVIFKRTIKDFQNVVRDCQNCKWDCQACNLGVSKLSSGIIKIAGNKHLTNKRFLCIKHNKQKGGTRFNIALVSLHVTRLHLYSYTTVPSRNMHWFIYDHFQQNYEIWLICTSEANLRNDKCDEICHKLNFSTEVQP